MPRKTEVTKPSDRRMSIVRQTRSQTAAVVAAEEVEEYNLQIPMEDDAAIGSEFEPSMIDSTGGDDNDCAGCDRPNNAEMYMVQCDKCECFYHFSCAKVDTATVKDNSFVCTTCLPPHHTQAKSMSSLSSTSSVRAARIARELQRLDEERKLQEELEKIRLEELQRKQAYIAKKYELLSQQDENDERRSRCSDRSSRTTSDRVKDWAHEQRPAIESGQTVEHVTVTSADSIAFPNTDPVDQLDINYNSTLLPEGQSAAQVLRESSLRSGVARKMNVASQPNIPDGFPKQSLIPLVDTGGCGE